MQNIWKEARDSLAKLQRKSIRMQRKLFLYWLSMLLVVLSIFLVVLHLAGVFSALDQEVNQLLLARQKSVITDLSYQLGKITAQGISVSEQATASCIYTQKGNKKIRKPQAANQTALIFDRRAAARLLSINSIRRLCWS